MRFYARTGRCSSRRVSTSRLPQFVGAANAPSSVQRSPRSPRRDALSRVEADASVRAALGSDRPVEIPLRGVLPVAWLVGLPRIPGATGLGIIRRRERQTVGPFGPIGYYNRPVAVYPSPWPYGGWYAGW